MTGTELQQMLDAHCQEMKAGMPGFLRDIELHRWHDTFKSVC